MVSNRNIWREISEKRLNDCLLLYYGVLGVTGHNYKYDFFIIVSNSYILPLVSKKQLHNNLSHATEIDKLIIKHNLQSLSCMSHVDRRIQSSCHAYAA